MNNAYKNPWAGPVSYPIPQNDGNDLDFYGRTDDIKHLSRLISENTLVTLYGVSGVGKTSLLQAGVYPYLGTELFLPVFIRFDKSQKGIANMFITLRKSIEESAEHQNCNVQFSIQAEEIIDKNFLIYLLNHLTCQNNNQQVCPIIIFDQFEEMLRSRYDDAVILLKQIYYLMNNMHISACNTNCRFVISIREDDLYLLEDSIDVNYLYDMKNCRYRLRALTPECAREVIVKSGEKVLPQDQTAKERLICDILKLSTNEEDGNISTITLSLVCSMLYDEMFAKGSTFISLDSYKDKDGNLKEYFFFDQYYKESVKGLFNDTIAYLEDNFVVNGRRVSIPLPDNVKGKNKETKEKKFINQLLALTEGKKKLLQKTGNNKVELIHDAFCDVLSKAKELRMQEKKRQKRNQKLFLSGIISVFFLCLSIILFYQKKQLSITNSVLKENRARFLSEKGMKLIDDGDFYSAQLLALEILPKDLSHPDRPFVPEAEGLMRLSFGIDNVLLQDLPGFVNKAIYSPNGELIVAAFENPYIVKFWNAKSGAEINELQHFGPVSSISYSSDGRLFITSTKSNATISIWDAHQKKLISTIQSEKNDCINDVAISPDGQLIAAALGNYEMEYGSISFPIESERVVKVWKRDSGELIWKSPHFSSSVGSVSFSPDGRLLAGVGISNIIRVWDVPSYNLRYTLETSSSRTAAVFSPNGKYLCFGKGDKIMLVAPLTGKTIKVLKSSEYYLGEIADIAFSPDNYHVASLTTAGNAFVWNIERASIEHERKVHGSGRFGSVAWSPKGKTILTTSVDDRTIRSWQLDHHDEYITIEDKSGIYFISYSHMGDSIYGIKSYNNSDADLFVVCDAKNFAIKDSCLLKSNFSSFIYGTVYDIEKRLVLLLSKKDFYVQSLSSGEIIRTFSDTCYIRGAAFHPIKNRISTVYYNLPIIKEWSIDGGKLVRILEKANGSFSDVVYSPNGQYIAAFSDDSHIYIWDEKTGSLIQMLRADYPSANSLKFSPDNQFLMANYNCGSTIWRTKDWKRLHNLRITLDDVIDANFSSDSKFIVQSVKYGDNYYLHIWNIEAGCRICTYDGGECDINNAVFSPDGRKILSQTGDEKIIIRDFPTLQELIYKSVERFKNRKLTEKERKKYYLD